MNSNDKLMQLKSESDKLEKELGIEPRKMGSAESDLFFREWYENDEKYDNV